MAILTCLIGMSSIGIYQVLSDWKEMVKVQLHLDQCVLEAAQKFQNSMNQIEKSNTRIKIIRKALLPAQLLPKARIALSLALKIEVFNQKRVQITWKFFQTAWILRRGCNLPRGIAGPLPSLDWIRPPPDILGPQPLKRIHTNKNSFLVLAIRYPRKSAISIYEKKSNWFKRWTEPTRPGFR